VRKQQGSPTKIPGPAEWAGYEDDLDVRYAHKLFFGKRASEVLACFGDGRSIERSSELLFMPRRAFQYYVFAFAEYLMSARAAGDSDSASPFLLLLISREKRDPGSVSQVYPALRPTIDFVASNQKYFDADPNIYGSFPELRLEIAALCEGPHARV
jgi:hypothetical protein